MYITYEMCQGMGACRPALDWIQDTFPNGAEFQVMAKACPVPSWVVWLGARIIPDPQGFAFKCAGQAFRYASAFHPSLIQYADNVTPANWSEARMAAAADGAYAALDAADAAYDAANAAVYAANAAYAAAEAEAAYAAAAAYAAGAANAAYDAAYKEQSRWVFEQLGMEVSA